MKLWEYSGNHVRITDTEGQIYIGFADFYTSELDDPDEIATLSLKQDNTDGILIDFEENDIASIEVIPANASTSAFSTHVKKVV